MSVSQSNYKSYTSINNNRNSLFNNYHNLLPDNLFIQEVTEDNENNENYEGDKLEHNLMTKTKTPKAKFDNVDNFAQSEKLYTVDINYIEGDSNNTSNMNKLNVTDNLKNNLALLIGCEDEYDASSPKLDTKMRIQREVTNR